MPSIEFEGDPWANPESVPQLEKCPVDGCSETQIVVQECAPDHTWAASCDQGHWAMIFKKEQP